MNAYEFAIARASAVATYEANLAVPRSATRNCFACTEREALRWAGLAAIIATAALPVLVYLLFGC